MKTKLQELGAWGEKFVAKRFACPRCKRYHTLRRLPPGFKCADVICDFCGYLAQVKTITGNQRFVLPKLILGGAWKPQKERMQAGIYFPLFIVVKHGATCKVFYIPIDFQSSKLFKKRKPLSESARRAGWQGFYYDLGAISRDVVVGVYQGKLNDKKQCDVNACIAE